MADCMLTACVDVQWDLIVLPGGMPGAERLASTAELITLLKAQRAAGKLVAAMCASPAVVLAPHGLAAGLAVTAHPAFVADVTPLASKGDSTQGRVVVDGDLVTSRGPGTVRCHDAVRAGHLSLSRCSGESHKGTSKPGVALRRHREHHAVCAVPAKMKPGGDTKVSAGAFRQAGDGVRSMFSGEALRQRQGAGGGGTAGRLQVPIEPPAYTYVSLGYRSVSAWNPLHGDAGDAATGVGAQDTAGTV